MLLSFCSFSTKESNAQTVNLSTSNLPIIIIESGFDPINEDVKVQASMKIVYRGDGQTTFINDQNNPAYLEYDGFIGINIRGSSSLDFAKKQYSIELWDAANQTNPTNIFGMGSEQDWILQAPYIDKTMMRNVLTYQLSNEMGQYAVETKFCEMILDGDYKGVYVFMERIKIDNDRLDLEDLDPILDNTQPNITGGYIWKVDKGEADNSDGFTTAETDRYRYHDPNPNNISTAQGNYLKSELESFEAIMNNGGNIADPLTGYPSKIDVSTWVDQFILQEWTKNPDAFGSSMYYHKYRNGKLRMGPVWDLNLALGASYHGFANFSTDWTTDFGHALIGPSYNQELFDDPTFQCLMRDRWDELRSPGQPLHINSINAVIDSIYNLLNAGPQQRNYTRWDILGKQVWLEAPGAQTRDTYLKEIDYMKDWIADRLDWVDSNMPSGTCPTPTPQNSLVINEIMYNPAVTGTQIEGDYEFIEIYNNGNSTVNLTGLQFSMGIHYTFPSGSLAPGQYLMLAGNASTYQQRYGSSADGVFAGGISNGGELIVLADPYGFALDQVDYNDGVPWPVLADGEGPSIELRNPGLDNNNAANWFSNFGFEGSPDAQNVEQSISCTTPAPNLVISEINYNSNAVADAGDWIEIYNNSGSTVSLSGWSVQDEGNTYNFPNTNLAAGAYIVVAQDLIAFNAQHSGVNVVGETGFGLSNGGEAIKLFDDRGCLVDEVTYDDAAPWPITPDGAGPTLTLSNLNADNSQASNWEAGPNGGTPGSGSGGGGVPVSGVKVLLEGFITSGANMRTDLLNDNLIPIVHPFGVAPFNVSQIAFVGSFPANTVDWVLLEVRSSSNRNLVLERKPILLRNDGMLMETTGSTNLNFSTSGSHYIAVYHKSHMGVISNATVNLSSVSYDFTTSVNQAFGTAQQKSVSGSAAMFAGDYDNNGLINNLDFNMWSSASALINQYLHWDADGNSIINVQDFNLWDNNKSKVGVSEIRF